MQRRIKRILAIHDMSGVGRCSLAVIAPILSAMGHQCCPLPTAVLSTHTGGFGEVELCDLTGYMRGAMARSPGVNRALRLERANPSVSLTMGHSTMATANPK